jgi:hypothetical protein
MGGFTSVTEGLPSGNNATASGVPMGNAANVNFTPDTSNFAMPETVGGNWANDAFAPAQAMTQQMPEPNDVQVKIAPPESVGWKPATLQETQSRNHLSENAFAPTTQAREDKLNPIVSKLAREHRDNPVPLRGSLLGEPETPKPAIKPPNPFAQKDELPKVDWTAYEKHRISGETRDSHDNWARLINSTKDFGGIIPTFKRHIETNGDVGRGDVADMIGRAAQSNPAHAQFFQRELSNALGGEMIPARMARMQGEMEDNSEAPGLLGAGKASQYPLAQMRDEDRRQLEIYKAEFEKKQQQPMATEEPRQSQANEPSQNANEPHNAWGLKIISKDKPDGLKGNEITQEEYDQMRKEAAKPHEWDTTAAAKYWEQKHLWNVPPNERNLAAYKELWVKDHATTIKVIARKHDIPPEVLAGIAHTEVGGDPDIQDSIAHAIRTGVPGTSSPDETSFGDVQIQLRRAAETLGMDPSKMGYSDRERLIQHLSDKTTNLDIVAKHIKDGMRDNFEYKGGAMTDAQIMQAGYGYNLRYNHEGIDRTSPAPDRIGNSSYGPDLLKKQRRMRQLLGTE